MKNKISPQEEPRLFKSKCREGYMTSITFVSDSEVSKEEIGNWIKLLIRKKLINGGFIEKILINDKQVLDWQQIAEYGKKQSKKKIL